MPFYISDDLPIVLPPPSDLASPIGGTVNVLDMIEQDVSYQSLKSDNTQVTYVRAAPAVAALPCRPTNILATGSNLEARPQYQSSAERWRNPFEINPFVADPMPQVTTLTSSEVQNKVSDTKSLTSAEKKKKCKTLGVQKTISKTSKKSTTVPKERQLYQFCVQKGGAVVPRNVESSAGSHSQVIHSRPVTTSTITTPFLPKNLYKRLIAATSSKSSHTVTKRAPVTIISPLHSTVLPTSVLYTTPAIITRTKSDGESVPTSDSPAEETRPKARLLIPVTLIPGTGCKHRAVRVVHKPKLVRVLQTQATSSAAGASTLPSGAALYSSGQHCKESRATKNPLMASVLDKGLFTTFTISPAATSTTLNVSQALTAKGSEETEVEATTHPKNQLVIQVPTSQVNTSPAVTPVTSTVTTTEYTPTTTIASHTITTISSQMLQRIRSRLLCNPPTATSNPSASETKRAPVTIIANQLLSVPRTTSAEPRTPNRVVIPLVSNVNSTSESSQGRYIIATTAAEATRSRVVIPLIHSSGSTVATTSATKSSLTVATSHDAFSKLRSRLTVPGTDKVQPTVYAIKRPQLSLCTRITPKKPAPNTDIKAMTLMAISQSQGATEQKNGSQTATSSVAETDVTTNRLMLKLASAVATDARASGSRVRTLPALKATDQRANTAARQTTQAKKIQTAPAPLQIFTDVVCPPSSGSTGSIPAKPRFTITHTPGTSTLVLPQYKNKVFRNLSAVAHLTSDSARVFRGTAERLVLNRSVAIVSRQPPTADKTQGAGSQRPAKTPTTSTDVTLMQTP